MEAGRLAEASELLSRPQASEPAEERLRLSAILAALQGNLSLVRSRLEELGGVARQDFASGLALIALRFFLSLAPGSPLQLTEFPNPIPLTLARQDEEARSLREDAIALCDAMSAGCDEEHKADLEVWKLACLLLDELHQARGLGYASDLVRRTRPHPGAIAWALAYGAQIDLKRLRTMLEARVGQDKRAHDVAALALIARLRRGAKTALRVVEKHGLGFRRADDIALMAMWRRDLSKQETDSGTRLPELVTRTTTTLPASSPCARQAPGSGRDQGTALAAEGWFGEGLRAADGWRPTASRVARSLQLAFRCRTQIEAK